MDPAFCDQLATAVTLFLTQVSVGAAREVGKDAVARIKSLLSLSQNPTPREIKESIVTLRASPDVLGQVQSLVPAHYFNAPASVVGQINADKVIAAQQIHIGGDLNM